jgi:MFS family permease
VLRAIAIAHAGTHLLWGVFSATYLLFAVQEIGLSAAAIGVVAALGGLGSFVGAATTSRLVARLGAGRTMVLGLAGFTAGNLLIPLAPGGAALVGGAFLVTQQLVGDAFGTIYEIVEQSVTQTIVHDRVLGRVNATIAVVTTLIALVGSIIGGVVGEVMGLRVAFAIGIVGGVFAAIAIWRSPAGRIQRIDEVRSAA